MRAIYLLGTSILLFAGLGGCTPEHRTVSRWDSPNGKLAAFLVESLVGRDDSVREDIYVQDASLSPNLGKPIFSGTGCGHLSYGWVNDYTLQIHYETICAISHFTVSVRCDPHCKAISGNDERVNIRGHRKTASCRQQQKLLATCGFPPGVVART